MKRLVSVATMVFGLGFANAEADNHYTYKYFTAKHFSSVKNLTSDNPDFSNVRVCAWPGWSIEKSGHAAKLKGVRHVKMHPQEVLGGAFRQICDIAAMPWFEPKWHAQILKSAKSMNLVEIKTLNPK